MHLYHLRPPVQRDVVDTLAQLLQGARDGQIVGLAVGAALPRRRYIVATAGECYRDPTYTRGIVRALDDELARLVQARALFTTR